MENKNSIWLWVAVVVLLALGVGYYLNQNRQAEQVVEQTQPPVEDKTETGPIKLGVLAPLTGDAAAYGEPYLNVVKMALAEINAKGGVNGRMLEAIYEDGKCNGKDGASAMQKLVNVDKVQAVLGGVCSSETLSAVPIATQGKVLLFSPGASSPDLTGASTFFFRNYPSDATQGKVLASLAVEKGLKKVAFIQEQKDYPLGIYKAFKAEFDKSNGMIVKEEFTSDATDFRSQLTKLRAEKPDALFIDSQTPASGSRVMKQLKEMGWKPQLFISDAVAGDVALVKENAALLEGTYAAEFGIDETNPLFQGLLKSYKSLYSADLPFQSYGQTEYDAVYLLVEGIKTVGYDGEKLAAWSRTIKDWAGASGKTTIEESGDRASGHVAKIIKNGKVELVK